MTWQSASPAAAPARLQHPHTTLPACLSLTLRYFTGLRDVPVLPNYCGYTGVTYAPERPEILVGPGREVHGGLFQELKVPRISSHPPPAFANVNVA